MNLTLFGYPCSAEAAVLPGPILYYTFAAQNPDFQIGVKAPLSITLNRPQALQSSIAKRVRAGFSPGYLTG